MAIRRVRARHRWRPWMSPQGVDQGWDRSSIGELIQCVFERPKAEVSFAFRTIQPVEESGHVNHARSRLQKVEIKQLLTGHSTHIQKPLNIAFKLSSRILRAEIATIPPLLLLAQAALVYNSFESTTKS